MFTAKAVRWANNGHSPRPIHSANLGPKAFRVTWEGTHMSDVLEVQKEHDDALQANTTSTMWLCAVAEGIDVSLDGRVVRRRHAELLQAAREKIHVVHTLRARENFLPADKKVVTVTELRVVRARHGVERAYGKRVFVEHEEVCLVLLRHHAAQGFLVLRTEIIELTLRVPRFLQHFHGFRKLETQGRAEVTQRLGGKLLTNGLS
jgi:hypothetical protein